MRLEAALAMPRETLLAEVRRGGRFVVFDFCLSFCVVTLTRSSPVIFVPAGHSPAAASLPYCLLSLCFGWWGFPFGLVYTPVTILKNLAGGRDVTTRVLPELAA